MKWLAVYCFAVLVFAGCAAHKTTLTKEDFVVIRALHTEYIKCLATNTAHFIDGSDDVAFLTKQVSWSCEHIPEKMKNELYRRNLSPTFVKVFIDKVQETGRRNVAALILYEKSKK